MDTGVLLLVEFFNSSIQRPDCRHMEAAIRGLGSIMEGPTCEKLTPSAGFHFALQKILYALKLSPNELLKCTVVSFLRRFFEFHHRAAVEALLALEQSTCDQIFDVLLGSMDDDDDPDVAENACYAVCFLAKCCPYLWNVLPKFSERCVCPLYRAAHRDVGQSGLRVAAYGALHQVVRFVAAPVISNLIYCGACDLKQALHTMDTTYRGQYIQYECRGLKVMLHKLGVSDVAKKFLKQHLDGIAESLLEVFDRTEDVDCWKDAVIAIGALAHAVGPAFKKHMSKFFNFWISGLRFMRAAELYDAMIGVMIRLSRALKGKILAFCDGILSQLHQDLFSTDLDENLKCSILSCNAELALAVGAHFHNYVARTLNVLQDLILRKHELLLKPESRHLTCAIVETCSAITQCFKKPSVSSWLRPLASDILNFLHLICGLDMDARVTVAAIFLVRRLVALPGENFSLMICQDKSIRRFLGQCSSSKDPLIKSCAKLAKSHILDATYSMRRRLLESDVSEKLLNLTILNPVQDQEHGYSEEELLSFFYILPKGVDSYETNSNTYDSLSIILSKDEEQVSKRILAGKILLTALRSEKKWDHLAHLSSSCISKCLVQTLFSCEDEACLMAIEILKHIGKSARHLYSIWFELEQFLCSDVDHEQPHVKDAIIEMLADVLKNFGPSSDRPRQKLINELHDTIFVKASERSDSAILNWLHILQYSHCSPKYMSPNIKNFIFDEATCPKSSKVKVAALECLTALCSIYGFDELEERRVRSVIFKAMKETDKCVANQAIVFWIPVCQREMKLVEGIHFVKKASKALLAVLREIILTRGTQHLEPSDPDQQEETPNLAKAAFECLHFVALTIGNTVIHLVEKDVLMGIESSDVWQKEAGIRAFGSILVGPTGQALSSLITSGFSMVSNACKDLMDNLLESRTANLRRAITWTLGQLFEFHPLILRKLLVGNHGIVCEFFYEVMMCKVADENDFYALSSFIQGLDYYNLFVGSLVGDPIGGKIDFIGGSIILADNGVGCLTNAAAYEFLCEICIRGCLSIGHVEMFTETVHNAHYDKYTIEEIKNLCRLFRIMVQMFKKGHPPTNIIDTLQSFLRCKSVIVWKEVMLAFGAIAYKCRHDFEVYMEGLEMCCKLGFQYFKQHSEVYLVMLRVMVDISRVQKKEMLQFCDKIIIPLFIDASDGQRKENWGTSISCICEIAGAVGGKKFLKRAMDMLADKTWFGIDRAYHLAVENIYHLRPGLVEAYRAIFQGLETYPVSDPLHRFADDTLDVLREFSNVLFKTDDMDAVIARRIIKVLECLRTFLSQSSLEKHTEFVQELGDYLCKARPSPIRLEKRLNSEGYELVEMYAIHVTTKQPCDLYGTIKVVAGMVSQCLYNQERGHAEPVSSGETSLSFNVLELIPCVEDVVFEVNLKHKVGDGCASTDGEVCRNRMCLPEHLYGSFTVEGKNGSVEILCKPFESAIPTHVKVSVLWPPAGIHGRIDVYNMKYPLGSRELFRRNETDASDPNKNNFRKINLCEGVVAVPLGSVLVVKADLWRYVAWRQSSIRLLKFAAEFYVTPDMATSMEFTDDKPGGPTTVVVEVYFGA